MLHFQTLIPKTSTFW